MSTFRNSFARDCGADSTLKVTQVSIYPIPLKLIILTLAMIQETPVCGSYCLSVADAERAALVQARGRGRVSGVDAVEAFLHALGDQKMDTTHG